jgi:rRNA maturation protein Nop10
MMRAKRCPNDNHGRMVVRIRFCPSCGQVLNDKIASRKCPADAHAKMRRSRSTYCMDCGEGLV